MKLFPSLRTTTAALLVLFLSYTHTHAHTNLREEGNKQAATAIDALKAEQPNPVINTWKDEKTGTFYAQNQIFITNTDATRSICDVKFSVPIEQAAKTKVESSYVSDVKTKGNGLEGTLPDYTKQIPPKQMVNLGYLISGPTADAVKMGAFKVTSAKFCDA